MDCCTLCKSPTQTWYPRYVIVGVSRYTTLGLTHGSLKSHIYKDLGRLAEASQDLSRQTNDLHPQIICRANPSLARRTSTIMPHLVNPLATASQLYNRASFSSLPQDLQETIFIATQCLTQAAGLLLELPQSVTAQANVILARYWLVDSPMASEFSVSQSMPARLRRLVVSCFRSCAIAYSNIGRIRCSHLSCC